jgi:hypothetical protein
MEPPVEATGNIGGCVIIIKSLGWAELPQPFGRAPLLHPATVRH